MTAILAFLIVTLSFAIGDMICMKTKGIISSFVFTILVFVIFGGTLHIFPEDMIATAGLSNMLVSFGMGLIFTNIGSSLNVRELVAQWKTILVTLAGMALVTIFCFTLGSAIFGREQALSAAGTLCGGFGATVLTSELANAAGRGDIAIFVTVMMTFQNLIGAPIASVCLSKEADRFIAKGGMTTVVETAKPEEDKKKKFSIRFSQDMPEWTKSSMMYFAKLSLVAYIGELVSKGTGWNATVCYLLMGFLFTEIGFLEKGSLKKSGGESLILLGAYAYLLVNYLSLPIEDLLKMFVPGFGLLICGAIAASIGAFICGKLLKWSPFMSVAVGVTCLLGYPLTQGLAMEAVNSHTIGKGYSEEEVQSLTNHLLPKMIIGGVISVSIVSVIIASFIGPVIF